MPIATAQDAAILFDSLFAEAAEERIAALYLGADGARLALEMIGGKGERGSVALPIRGIIARALALGASAVVIAHNHPSGDPNPSAADRAATRRLAMVCEALGIALHDHLIFAGGQCESFRRLGLL